MRRHLSLLVAPLAVAAVLTGCASPPPSAPGGAPASPAHPSSAAPPSSGPAAAPAPDAGADQAPVVDEYPELDVQSWDATADDALATATRTVSIYLDPVAPTWWADLSALLSPHAQGVYETVDPAVVPTGEVTGPATALAPGDLLATVRVPTTVGDLDVQLTRATTATGGWEVDQITPADPA